MAFAARSLTSALVAKTSASGKAKASAAPTRAVVRAGLYPEPGTFPGGDGKSPIFELNDEKNVAREVIHGRFAMLGVTGAVAQENAGAGPWFNAGALCSPEACSLTYPEFAVPWADGGLTLSESFPFVVGVQALTFGLAEALRTGTIDSVYPDYDMLYPGNTFDPLGLYDKWGDNQNLKIAELKHCRLAMWAWLGCIAQAIATNDSPESAVGPVANWQAHVSAPFQYNITTTLF
mmetsp:Transcript_14010/g.50960  ORF Transcript_14010/g.50960 Transcript_14010/m.50960 type:complete len:234 (-) Transcript_14010:217-918(-)